MVGQYPIDYRIFRQPHLTLLLAHDSDQHHLYLHHNAKPRWRTNAGYEMDDVLDAGDVHGILQQLRIRS